MTFQEWCKEILPIVQAGANGEEIEYLHQGKFWSTKVFPTLEYETEYRIKPKTIKVNGFDVPEPVRNPLNKGDMYYMPNTYSERFYRKFTWMNDMDDKRSLERNLIHMTEKAAVAHAKAMLGIDPNKE